ncbi:MAG: hypothetical protein ACK5SX_11340, partial [Sandaracinobacter sp.]
DLAEQPAQHKKADRELVRSAEWQAREKELERQRKWPKEQLRETDRERSRNRNGRQSIEQKIFSNVKSLVTLNHLTYHNGATLLPLAKWA